MFAIHFGEERRYAREAACSPRAIAPIKSFAYLYCALQPFRYSSKHSSLISHEMEDFLLALLTRDTRDTHAWDLPPFGSPKPVFEAAMNAGYRRQEERGLSLMVETESSKRGGITAATQHGGKIQRARSS